MRPVDLVGAQTPFHEWDGRLGEIFDRLAPRYDRLLDVQSLGLHRYWRRTLVKAMSPRAGQRILDAAGGRGEMAKRIAASDRQVVVLDRSLPMIEAGRSTSGENIDWAEGRVEALPFGDASMDSVVCAFGMRNVDCIEEALGEFLRVLKPGGYFFCLEVSRPWRALRPLYRAFCRYLVPALGALVVRVPGAYEYLVSSILEFPARIEVKRRLENAGFVSVRFHCLTMGIVCIHVGARP